MREYRFRAWHTAAKEMFYEQNTGDVFRWQVEKQQIEIMQYTLLEDKNGREIYAGDVLRVGDLPVYVAEVVYDDHFGAWGLQRDDVLSVHVGDYDRDDREVIGNIYENPELVGEQG